LLRGRCQYGPRAILPCAKWRDRAMTEAPFVSRGVVFMLPVQF